MTALPASTDWTGASITEGDFKTAQTNLRSYLASLLGTDGTSATALATLGVLCNSTVTKTGAYTVVAGDRGKLFLCSGTWTLALTGSATLGDGFAFAIQNTGSGTITIDPSGSEQIDAATTIAIGPGESGVVQCTGSAFRTIGRTSGTRVSSNDTTPGFLDGKLVAGSGITLTQNNDGANETLSIIFSGTSAAGSWEKIAEALPSGASAVTWTNATITADYDDLMIVYEIYGAYGGGGVAFRTGGADGVIDTGGSDYFDNGGSTNECTLGGAYAGTSTGIVMLFNIQEARYTNILSQNIYIDGITSQITILPYGRKEAAAVRAVSIYITGGSSFSGRVTLLGRKGI